MNDPSVPREITIDPEKITKAAAILKGGGLVIIPTHGLYGIAADIFNPAAVNRVFTLKGRPKDKPLLALINHMDMLPLLAKSIPRRVERLMSQLWPGQVTFVLHAQPDLPAGICSADSKVGVRLVAHPMAAALIAAAGTPLTGTSANLSGQAGCAAIDQIPQAVKAGVDMVLDAGPLAGGPGSTVVDVTGEKPLILRQGALAADAITTALNSI